MGLQSPPNFLTSLCRSPENCLNGSLASSRCINLTQPLPLEGRVAGKRVERSPCSIVNVKANRKTNKTAIVTGASRKIAIAAAVARALARDGWNVVTTFWRPYDASMPWGSNAREAEALIRELKRLGVRAAMHEDNLEDPDSAHRIFDAAESQIGPVRALVNAHAHSTRGERTNCQLHQRTAAGWRNRLCGQQGRDRMDHGIERGGTRLARNHRQRDQPRAQRYRLDGCAP